MHNKTILLDIGDIIAYTTPNNHYKKLSEITGIYWKAIKDLLEIDNLIDNFETGKIEYYEFKNNVESRLGVVFDDNVFFEAWSAIIDGFNYELLEYLITNKYNIIFASNTNEIHWKVINMNLTRNKFPIKKVFLSFEEKIKKPDLQFFQGILRKFNLSENKVIFIDDSYLNIKAAESIRINSHLFINNNNCIKFIENNLD